MSVNETDVSAGTLIAQVFDSASAFETPPDYLEMLPVAVYACDAQGRILWYNARAAALWGRKPRLRDDAELYCGAHKLHFHGRPVAHHETPLAEVLRTGKPIEGVQGVIERADGSRVTIMVHIAPVRAANDTLIGAVNCFHTVPALDQAVAERRRVQERLVESEKFHRQLLDSLPVAVYTTDAEGRITYYNQAAVDLSGRRPTLGTDEWCVTLRLYRPDGTPLPHDECPMAVALKDKRAIRNVEAMAERPDGTRFPFIPYPTPLFDNEGKLVGAVNVLADISDRKDAETQQKMLLDELNHRVKNNMQMLHSLLYAARKDASHPEARAALTDASQRVAAMAASQQVLYDMRSPYSFDAGDFLESVCGSAQQSFAKGTGIIIEATSGQLPNDAAMPLALILNELLTNAVKHGGGEGPIRVGLTREADIFCLYVQDNGPGFTLGTLAHRASGLGLVKGLAHQLDGTFEVVTSRGARCIVAFPDRGTHK